MLADLLHGSFDLLDKVIHLLTPVLGVVFSDPFQFTEKMRIAETMTGWILEIRRPEIMDHRTTEPWQDRQAIHCLGPSFPIVAICSQDLGTCYMESLSDAVHPHPGLVHVDYLRTCQKVSYLLFYSSKIPGTLGHCPGQGRFAHGPPRTGH
jgi:hypothetical protein